MGKDWISPNTITGDAATGERYIRRQYINDDFWREVKKGNHILFVAPRRVGKTSIMKDLADNPPEGYYCIYRDIEGVKTKNEFYKRLFELFIKCVGKADMAKALVAKWWKSFGIEEITQAGIKFKEKEVDYETELRNLIPQLKDVGVNTVIFLDEFAEVINKLNKQGNEQDAIDILHTLREIRSDEDFTHFTLVFAGSIGLEFVINAISRPKLINDLHRIETVALSDGEASELISQVTDNATIQFDDEAEKYLKSKVDHLLPYYIQLMIEEIDLIAREQDVPGISNVMIDDAFERVLAKNKNFEDWLIRLREYHADKFPFINAILIECAYKGQILIQEIYNLANDEKYNRAEDYMDYVRQLVNDGYIVEHAPKQYRFISPFLQQFWINQYPVYNGR